MNNSMYSNRNSFNNSFTNLSKINPFNPRKTAHIANNFSKKKFLIPNSNREFGKEINISSNLATNNQEIFNNRKSMGIPIEQKYKNLKKEKELLNNRLKNFDQIIAIRKKKKPISNSMMIYKPNNSSSKYQSSKGSIVKIKKDNKFKYKNQSQKNIFNANKTMNINDDIVMIDENSNPNIINNNNNNENEKNINIDQPKNQNDEDVEMEIENENSNNNSINNEPQKFSNPQNADEYFEDICEELHKNEDKYLVDPKYMSNQSDINYRMRAILIDWLIEVHLKYKLLPQTMYIAVNLIDRYLEKNETNRAKLQLVGVTAMFIACKYEEIYPPELKDFVYITDGAYVKSDVLKMEEKMLNSLNFDITFPTQWTIFETYERKLDLDEKTFKLAWFLMELCLINYKTLKFKMSYIAASAILIASKTMRVYSNNWFYKNIGIEEKALEECCKEMYEFYTYNATHNLQAIRKKFSSAKFDEVAKIKLC
jgi:cyclin B